jgi:GntR family transcriptional repressor for pyruvate dehydrogenase complex
MEKLNFKPIPISRISDHIEKTIKEAILNENLKSGDKLPTEKEMALQFGVSLVTLREALRSLEIFGLIVKRKGHGGGIFVSEVDSESIKTSLGRFLSFKDLSLQHLYEVRIIVEPPSIKLAAQKITPDEIKRLEENVFYCQQKLSKIDSLFNEKEFFDLDEKCIDFHKIIADSARNPILSLTIEYVFDFLSEYESKMLIPDINYSTDTVKDHRNILELLKEGDAEKCEKEMIKH